MVRQAKSSTKKGAEFESQTAALLTAAGYKIERNPSLPGQQIDLIATSFDTIGLSRQIVVECKYLNQGSVSNAAVQDFINYVRPLLDKGISSGILISNRDFSLSAKHYAASFPYITLKTYSELEDSLFDFSQSFVSCTNTYRHSHINETYIGLLGSRTISKRFKFDSYEHSQSRKVEVAEDILTNLQGSLPFFAFILGDFGVGKTTIIDRVVYTLQETYLKDRTSRIPFVFRLNRFPEANNLSQFIESQIEFSLSKKVPALRFYNLCAQGRTAVFLDGFDEIATNASEYRRRSYFENLLPLLDISPYTVVSSRSAYFQSVDEFHKLVGLVTNRRFSSGRPGRTLPRANDISLRKVASATWQGLQREILGGGDFQFLTKENYVYDIFKLNGSQIVEYLSKYETAIRGIYNTKTKDVFKILSRVYDISDLMTRPLLLKLIVEVLMLGHIDIHDPNLSIGPAALYRMYVDAHLDTDWQKGPSRHFLEKQERLLFARGMALAMLTGDGSLVVGYEEIVDSIINVLKSFPAERRSVLLNQTDEVCTDVRVCSFLRLIEGNNFQFIHKSFMEYFVADHIREELDTEDLISALQYNLNSEILYFLGSFVLTEGDLWDMLLLHLQPAKGRSAIYRRNVLGAMLFSGEVIGNFVAENCTLFGVKLKNSKIVGAVFEKIICREIEADKLTFESTDLDDVAFERVKAEELSCLDCTGDFRFLNCNISNLRIDGQDGTKVFLEGGRISNLEIRNCGNVAISDKIGSETEKINKTTITYDGNRKLQSKPPKIYATGSCFHSEEGSDGTLFRRFEKAKFSDCEFRNFHIFIPDTKDLQISGCKGLLFLAANFHTVDRFRKSHDDDLATRKRWALVGQTLIIDEIKHKVLNMKRLYSAYKVLLSDPNDADNLEELDAVIE